MSSINDLLKKFKNRDAKGSVASTSGNGRDARDEKIKLFNNFKNSACKSNVTEASLASIGILILIIDDFPHENIWRKWLATTSSSSNADSIKVLIHAKNPENVKSDWVKERLVKTFQYKPQWGSSDLTRAMIGLMKEMLSTESSVKKVIFASETCIPIVPLDMFLKMTTCDNDSWINYSNESKNGYATQKQWDPMLNNLFPKDCIVKGDQWNLLSRSHVIDILNCPIQLFNMDPLSGTHTSVFRKGSIFHNNSRENKLLDNFFMGVTATDEMYVPSCLCLCGHLPRLVNNQLVKASTPLGEGGGTYSTIKRQACTFVEWCPEDNSSIAMHPRTFCQLKKDLLLDARICNHPLINTCGSHNHVRNKTKQYLSLKSSYDIDNLKYSSLFLRKMRTSSRAEQTCLYNDWCKLVLHCEPDTVSGDDIKLQPAVPTNSEIGVAVDTNKSNCEAALESEPESEAGPCLKKRKLDATDA